MNRKFLILVLFIALAGFAHQTFSQFAMKSTFSSMYDDNVNNNSQNLKSSVSGLNINGSYSWEDETALLKIFYDGSFNYYASLIERSNQYHSVNAAYTHLYGDENQNILDIGGSLGTGINRDEYNIFNHTSYYTYMNYKCFQSERIINKFGYAFRYMDFSTLTDLNYAEHAVYTHAAFAFSQATTIIAQAELGSKFYSTDASSDSGSGKKGKSSILPAVAQITGLVKIGQKLTDVSGLSLTSKYQWNILKQVRYLSSDYGLVSDDELFDDHYGYEGLQASLMYTHIISESAIAKLSGGFVNKRYSTMPAYDLDGNIIANERLDARAYINLQLHKSFEELGFSAKASLDIINNKSNDPLYNYQNNAISLEITVPF